MAAVLAVDTNYSPRLKLYSLKNGTTLDCKIDKRTFNRDKLEVGDIVRITSTKEKPKSRKNENGEWESIPGTKELWVNAHHSLFHPPPKVTHIFYIYVTVLFVLILKATYFRFYDKH